MLAQGAAQAEAKPALAQLPALASEQVAVARRQVDWHLARSRSAAAAHGLPGLSSLRTPLLHAERGLKLRLYASYALAFAGEPQDLQETLGNLLDNACKAARTQVQLHASPSGSQLHITVDDGPGSGLGLAIVQDLATLYGGALHLGSSPLGGLRAELVLPAA